MRTKIKFLLLLLFILPFSLFAQKNLTLRANLSYPGQTLAGLWGYVDGSGNEYALVGASNGLSIVDVTDPANPVEKFTVTTVNNLWHEVEVWNNHAYVTTEGGGGVLIVDLTNLPASVNSKFWTGNGAVTGLVNAIHTLQIADGYLYLYGGDYSTGGCIIADLSDPWNPNYVGEYEGNYVHDGYVRNDTMYAGEIYSGQVNIIDVTNKSNPVPITTQPTPGAFTHNTWLSDDSQTLFTTDETGGSPMTAYDISDLSNIKELFQFKTTITPDEEVHNIYVLNDFLVGACYGSQITIVDGARPDNLIEVGYHSTVGGDLCWDVYSELPSGNIIAGDMNDGLFIFTPVYIRACYLEGIVTDSTTGMPINNALVEILSTTATANSKLTGEYKTGLADAGTYDVRFSKAGYNTKTITGVNLTNGVLTTLDAQLSGAASFTQTGIVRESATGNPVPNAYVRIKNGTFTYDVMADGGGNFTINPFFAGTYEVYGGKWGYVNKAYSGMNITSSTGLITIELDKGIYDDFTFDFGWSAAGTALTGLWERGEPIGTAWGSPIWANPDSDVTTDVSDECYMTGNGGGGAGSDDVDDGTSNLYSPTFDLSGFADPYINYNRWFVNVGGAGAPDDTLKIKLSNGSSTATLENVTASDPDMGGWVNKSLRVKDFLTPNATMQMILETSDLSASGHIVEAGIDMFYISEGIVGIKDDLPSDDKIFFRIYPNPFSGNAQIHYSLNQIPARGAKIQIMDLMGRSIEEIPVNEQSGTLEIGKNISSGMYFVKIQNGNNYSEVKKIIRMQ